MDLIPLDPAVPNSPQQVAGLWNAACGPDLAISERLARFDLGAATGAAAAGCLAHLLGQPAGFVWASTTTRPVDGVSHPSGWIEAVAVLPEARRQGIGSRLLAWAEAWLQENGCPAARLGGGLRPFVPGLPAQLDNYPFFQKRGYRLRTPEGQVWDVARSLEDYTPGASPPRPALAVRPLQASEIDSLDAFLGREFPGRWQFEFREHLRLGGRPSDYQVLWTERGVEGFCQLTLEDSVRPVERYLPHGLPHPWGHLGPIGVSAASRGQGLGAVLLDAGLSELRRRGAAGCVIDWTGIPGFYQKFGFHLHREYLILSKELPAHA